MQARLQAESRRQRVECNGYFNSQWIAAIDNTGKKLVLHNFDSVQLVKRTSGDERID
jgi:hypothetical protein